MKKIAIFNVGGASSAYIEYDISKTVVDLGGGNDFSPTDDFLLPLAKKSNWNKDETGVYKFNQLFLTHLDNDHISDYPKFIKNFRSQLLTVPNDHKDIVEHLKIDRHKIPNNEIVNSILEDARRRVPGRFPDAPNYEQHLQVFDKNWMFLSYIPPKECIELDLLSESGYEQYSNNISLVILLLINNHTILFPGDIMNEGMEYLIDNNGELKNRLTRGGVDFLVAPHHGLKTSFPISLFETIKGNKVKLNIISEKYEQKTDEESRSNVDSRYSSPEFAEGYKIINGLKDFQRSIMTSNSLNTHIVIDFDSRIPIVKRCTTEEALNEFT